MCAAAFDFVAERGFIEASVDPHEILDWMSDYGRRRRAAAGKATTRRQPSSTSCTVRPRIAWSS